MVSYALRAALALSRTISASISWIAACIIVYKIILRYRANHRQHHDTVEMTTSHSGALEITTYHRLLLGIAILDICHTSWAALSTLPVPASSGVIFGRGTTATCTAQGFFIQLSSAVPLYMASLNTYFMLKIRYQIPNDVIRKKYEPWFHLIPITQALIFGCIGIWLELYNPIVIPEMGCWISPYPALCNIYGNCTRGYKLDQYLDLYGWLFAYGWLFLSFLVVFVNSVLIYTAIRHHERRNERYRFPLPPTPHSNQEHLNNSSLLLSSQPRLSSLQSRMSIEITSQPPSEIHIENYDINEAAANVHVMDGTTTPQENFEDGEPSSETKFGSSATRMKKEKLSRIAAFQSFLFCSSTFFVAFWAFMSWMVYKINATTYAFYLCAFMVNIIHPSQGIFNLCIIVRIQYKKLRTKEKWSRWKCLRECLFSPDIQ